MQLTTLAAEHGDKPAIIMGASGETLSYRELEARSNQIAHLFREHGLGAGDHIAILLENRLEIFPIVWAAQRSGLLYTPVNWHLSPAEAAYIVDNCEAKLLISSSSLESIAAPAAASASRLTSRLVVGERVEGVEHLDSAIADLSREPISDEAEGYYMFYSSGTTGRPKGILPELSGESFGTGLSIDHTMRAAFSFSAATRFLSTGPLYHAAPLAWCIGAVRNGGTAVVMEKFDAEAVLRLIDRHRITHAQFVPTMFVRMLKLADDVRAAYDVSSVQLAIHAAAPCPIEVKERMIEWFGPTLVEFYAGSEGNGFFMIDSPTWLTHKGSVGTALTGVVHICDDEGRELGPHEIGTIWLSDNKRFEYHGDPVKTAAAYNDKGWSTLGDLGHVDQEGFLYLSDRRTDLILSGGVNIYPREIEDALTLHPAVGDVAVIGLPDGEMGQRVHAVIEVAEGSTPGPELAESLIGFCRDRLAHFKAPRSVSFEPVPRLPSGKILKRELMQRFQDASTR
ncbi:AMP-binding protein [Aeromicrobium sp. S22]|uniref:acyl-CoA synthetase n=1 Tax=Aeromicrobium sp. S22 TaxID=2662029 RepID=UPI00129E4739|nr:acyl-CoA synthetase [Aeromicrobium sp. S22]MRK01690.1 AMP-binding protein [Aeromicrobium sp. S22]